MAGFWAGFGEQMSSQIEQRKKTLDRLVEENLDNARRAKREFGERSNIADIVLKSAEAIRSKFGLDEAQSLALVEAYGVDLPKLQATLDVKNDELKSSLGVGYNAQDVMSFTNTAEKLNLPEGMTLADGVNRLMGINATELSKEKNPKSEGAKTRSFIRSALAYDPQLQAAEKMQELKGPGGFSYAELLEMEQAGFAPEDVYGDVTRAGGVTYDYTTSTAKATRTEYSRRFSNELVEISDPTDSISWQNLTLDGERDKDKIKADIFTAGDAMSRLEREIVLSFRGTDMAMNAFRKSVLDDITERVNEDAELLTLAKSIKEGNAIEIIKSKNGILTTEDIDAIIAGEAIEKDDDVVTEDLEKATPEPVVTPEETTTDVEPELPQPEVSTEEIIPPTPSDSDTTLSPDISVDPEVDRMVSEAMEAPQPEAAGWFPKGMVAGNAANVAARLEQNKNDLRTNMADVTREEWKDMPRSERKDKGLPVRPIDMWFAGGDAFKGAQEPAEQKSKPIPNTSEFVEVYFNDILDFFDENETDTTDKEDIKSTLAAWFSDNAANLEVSGTLSTDDLTEIMFKAMNP
jgi:hypothetical protein